MSRQKITEEEGIHKSWMKEANEIKTTEELKAFIDRLQNDYEHDYGTICHAVAAAAIAAAKCVDRGPQGGITGFQAGAIQWEMIRGWGVWTDGPLQIVQWGQLLFPQYDDKMPRFVSKDIFKALVAKAKEKLEDTSREPVWHEHVHPDVKARFELLASGKAPDWLTVKEDD